MIERGDGFPVAVPKCHQPVFYCVPVDTYEQLMAKLEDLELAQLVAKRKEQPEMAVDINDL